MTPIDIAREALALAEAVERAEAEYQKDPRRTTARACVHAERRLVTHASQHYATIARALIAAEERMREIARERDDAIAKVRHYEETVTMRQTRRKHPDGTWTFEPDVQKLGVLMDELEAARAALARKDQP